MSYRRTWSLGVAPLAIFYLAFFVLPEIYFASKAFYRSDDLGRTTGAATTDTFTSVLTDGYYLNAILRTVELCLITTVLTVFLAYPIAYACVRSRVWGRTIFICVAAAMFSNAVARVLGWRVLLALDGPINKIVVGLGLSDHPLALTNNFLGVTIGTVHAMLPIAVIGLMPVCEAVSREQLEAASGLGASSWRTFRTVLLPQASGGLISIGMLVFAVTAGAFTTPALLGGGRVAVLPILIYTAANQSLDYSTAAVLGIVLFVLVMLAVMAGLLIGRRGAAHRATAAAKKVS